MSITPKQPGFFSQKEAGGIPASEYDNLSDEDLLKLINQANKLKGGKASLAPQRAPAPKKVIDLDALLGRDE